MQQFKILIADDDDGMRLILKKAIEKIEGFDIVGEAEDGRAVLRLFEKHKPHIVFMDVEMPEIDGVECAKRIVDINPKTIIIFATAHEDYMEEAFDLYAFDYMIKPFKIERLRKTLDRIRLLNPEEDDEAIYDVTPQANSLERLIIKNKEGISFVDTDEIILIQREERSTVIYTANERFTTSEGLNDLEEKLDNKVFMRSHKSYIININMIQKIMPYGRWTYIVKFKDTPMDALITHEKFEILQKRFRL